jgi:hypothetical protein
VSDQPSKLPPSPSTPPDGAKSPALTADELLFRQVNPSWRELDGNPTSQAFRPTPKDNELLSVDRQSLTDAKSSYDHFTKTLGLASVGTWAISTNECASVSRTAWHTPKAVNPAHTSVDFRAVPPKTAKTISQALKARAIARQLQYAPPPPPPEAPSPVTAGEASAAVDAMPPPEVGASGRIVQVDPPDDP